LEGSKKEVAQMNLNKTQLAMVDTETNNLPVYRDEDGSPDFTDVIATDVGIILLDGINDPNPVTHEFSFQMNEYDFRWNSDPEALRINGYDHEARNGLPVTDSREAAEKYKVMAELLRGRTLVASNTAFDEGVLRNAFISHGVCRPTGVRGEHWEPWAKRMVDVRAFSHLLMWKMGLENASVQTSYEFLVKHNLAPSIQGHRALNDAWKALAIVKHFSENLGWV